MEIITSLKKAIQNNIRMSITISLSIALLCIAGLHNLLYTNILLINRYEYDTHATGMLFFLLFISAGLLLPVKPGKTLRSLGAATYPVYLFHYLVVRLYNNNQDIHDAIARIGGLAVWPLSESILAASLTIFLLLLALGVAYNRVVLAVLVRGVDKAFSKPITLHRLK